MHVCVCARMCVRALVHMHVLVYIGRQKLTLMSLVFDTVSLPALGRADSLDWLARKPQGSSCLHLANASPEARMIAGGFFTLILEDQIRILRCTAILSNWATSSALLCTFLYTLAESLSHEAGNPKDVCTGDS